ncbi:MAG: hypothetical protein HY590_05400 [Candidatus Omnitrophica bacterium]|nr:hypothetical protein [Candidatus Omnitrophota bacterium]
MMVAVIVLAVALTVVSRSFISSLAALRLSADISKGGLLLEQKVWEFGQKGSLSPGQEEGTFEEFGGNFHWDVEVKEVKELPLYEADITVRWTSSGRERDLTVTTYLPKQDEET